MDSLGRPEGWPARWGQSGHPQHRRKLCLSSQQQWPACGDREHQKERLKRAPYSGQRIYWTKLSAVDRYTDAQRYFFYILLSHKHFERFKVVNSLFNLYQQSKPILVLSPMQEKPLSTQEEQLPFNYEIHKNARLTFKR